MKVLDALGARYAKRLCASQAAILGLHSPMAAETQVFGEQAVKDAEEEGIELD